MNNLTHSQDCRDGDGLSKQSGYIRDKRDTWGAWNIVCGTWLVLHGGVCTCKGQDAS